MAPSPAAQAFDPPLRRWYLAAVLPRRCLLKRSIAALCLAVLAVAALPGQERVDLDVITKIRLEGFNNSKVMDTAFELTDRIGPRLTGSPQMKAANEWTKAKLSEWGLVERAPGGVGAVRPRLDLRGLRRADDRARLRATDGDPRGVDGRDGGHRAREGRAGQDLQRGRAREVQGNAGREDRRLRRPPGDQAAREARCAALRRPGAGRARRLRDAGPPAPVRPGGLREAARAAPRGREAHDGGEGRSR